MKVIENGITLEAFKEEDTETVKQKYNKIGKWDNIWIGDNGDIILFDELPFD